MNEPKKKTLIIVTLSILLVFGWIIFQQNAFMEEPPVGDDFKEVPENWQTFKSSNFDFNFAYPPETDIRLESNNSVKITFLGPKNATGEITDGFTYTVSTYDYSGHTLETFTEDRYDSVLRAGDEIEGISQTVLKGMTSYHFVTESLGRVDHYILDHPFNNDVALEITYNISDPAQRDYRQIVDLITKSLNFEDVE